MRARSLIPSTLALALALLTPAAALADAETHDGFFLRLSTGLSFSRISADTTPEVAFSGAGSSTSFAFGGVVADNLILHADLFGQQMLDPTVEVGGQELGELRDASVGVAAIGMGITYYIMPVNLYLSCSLGLGAFSAKHRTSLGTVETSSDPGLGLNLMVGKEWWVSDDWGLGIAGQLVYVSVSESEADDGAQNNLSGAGYGVLFSATYN